MKKIILIIILVVVLIVAGSLILVNVKKDKALDIVLNDLGISQKDIDIVESNIDMEGLKLIYEVEFYYQNVKYDYSVDTNNNEIISIDKKGETKVDATSPINQTKETSTNISEEQASSIALKQAGVESVKNIIVEKDMDNGSLEYDIEFIHDGIKYECTVSNSGEVTSFEKEKVK